MNKLQELRSTAAKISAMTNQKDIKVDNRKVSNINSTGGSRNCSSGNCGSKNCGYHP